MTAAGDNDAVTFTSFLSIDTPRATAGSGKVGNVDGSNLVPSGRRISKVVSLGDICLDVSLVNSVEVVVVLLVVKQAFCMTGDW